MVSVLAEMFGLKNISGGGIGKHTLITAVRSMLNDGLCNISDCIASGGSRKRHRGHHAECKSLPGFN